MFSLFKFHQPLKKVCLLNQNFETSFLFRYFQSAQQALRNSGRKRERARARETRVSLSRALVFSCAHYFHAQATLFYLLYIFLSNCSYTDPDHSCSKVDSTDHFTSLVNCPPTPPQSQNQYLLFTQGKTLAWEGVGGQFSRNVYPMNTLSIQWITQLVSLTLV